MENNTYKKDKIGGFILFVFSLVYLYGCFGLKIGRANNPGPGFIPLLVGVGLLVFTSIHLYQVLRVKGEKSQTDEYKPAEKANFIVFLGIAACVLAYPFLLKQLSYLLSTFIIVFVMLILMKYKSPVISLLVSVIISVISYMLFTKALGVVLPMGAIEQLILSI